MQPELFHHGKISANRIAIVGGGIAACCLIDQILAANPKADIHIFCQDDALATRASGNKQGAIYPLLQTSNSPITQLMANSYQYALKYYQALVKRGVTFQHKWCGVLQQAMTADLEQRYQKLSKQWPELSQYIDAQTSSQLAGIELPFESLYFADGGWLFPQQLCRSLIELLQKQHQINLHYNQSIDEINRVNNKWQVSDPNSDSNIEFDALIIAAGHHSPMFKQTELIDIEPISGQVSQLQAESTLCPLQTVLCHKGYITPSQGQYQSFGATFNKNCTNELPTQSQQEKNLSQIKQKYPAQTWALNLENSDVINNKSAIRATTADHLPVVGELVSTEWMLKHLDKNTGKFRRSYLNNLSELKSDLPGLYVLTGLGARGLTTAPLLAKHLVSLMFGLSSPLSETEQKAVSPMRFALRRLKRHKKL